MARPRGTPGRAGQSVKLVVTGPFSAGKTTLIQAISEITVLSTERRVSDETAATKDITTVAMDFGRLTIDDDLVLYLFGTPGQQRFDFMWEILSEGMLGFVVVVDGTDEATYDQAAEILSFFRDGASVPYVVAVNKVTSDVERRCDRVRRRLDVPDDVCVIACDARDRESVKVVLIELFCAVLGAIGEPVPAPA